MNLIVAAENMNNEAIFILENYAGIEDASQRIVASRNASMRPSEKLKITASYQQHYVNVSSSNIDLLREIYKYDIYLFGYPDTPFVDFEKS